MVQNLNAILKGVSRSFYLSMRFLPARMRQPVSIAYLLARASDTLADTENVAAEQKLLALNLFRERQAEPLENLVEKVFTPHVSNPCEQELLRHLAELWQLAEQLESACLEPVAIVVDTIIQGQENDVQRFEVDGGEMESEQQLLDYCYQVAGCVGEFWSEVGVHTSPGFSNVSLQLLREWGRSFGQGLQLVNIIRDAPKDLAQGRVYIPGMRQLSLEKVSPWSDLARRGAYSGLQYSDSLSARWQRLATYLPACLALDTLDQLQVASLQQWQSGVKVPRSQVYREVFSGLLRPQQF